MKKRDFTWIKLLILVMIWGSFYQLHQVEIKELIGQTSLSPLDKVGGISRIMLGLPSSGTSQELSKGEDMELTSPEKPMQLSEEVISSQAYQTSLAKVNTFNEQLNLDLLNQHFTDKVNQMRVVSGWDTMQVGDTLAIGTKKRAEELSQYNYFGSQTAEGLDFRSQHQGVAESVGLSETIFEVYISTGDIHLETWAQYPNVLADYLLQVLPDLVVKTDYAQQTHQYVVAKLAPTPLTQNGSPYVRLIVVVTLVQEFQ